MCPQAPPAQRSPGAAQASLYPLDCNAYRRRNAIERLFCRLRTCWHIATRYDRLPSNYLASLALVAAASEWT